ncbi:MAG TPA: TrpB-like pyridoxal phosphate-dependent enzyme [bacterium]|nr:TrpB-like pyridoxal phosphate-dependent enzyme [bacterium]
MSGKKILLTEAEVPQKWYNVQADMPKPLDPPLNPATKQPIGPEALAPIFPMALIEQEVSTERWIAIPEEVMDILMIWRPTPLVRAERLEKALGTPARIYYKNESVSPPGSHKPNTAVAQAYYNKKQGLKRLTTETGAGQWGSALSFACQMLGLECTVYMVKVSYQQKPYRRSMMHTYGAEVFPSPTDRTNAGRGILAKDPECLGSLGIAISEAVEEAATRADTNYSLGSVLNHVLLHQTIVGLETKKQLEKANDKADIVIGCVGGGSNFAGMAFPFFPDKLAGKDIRFIGVEPCACPTLTRGVYAYDFGDTAQMTPLLKMHTLGHDFIPPGIHAGGLRYHGGAPLLCALINQGFIEAQAVHQTAAFKSALQFARTEGIIPAPETSHAICVGIQEALKCKETGEAKSIVIMFSGHGYFDMGSYDAYLAGKLQDYEYPAELIAESLKKLPQV